MEWILVVLLLAIGVRLLYVEAQLKELLWEHKETNALLKEWMQKR